MRETAAMHDRPLGFFHGLRCALLLYALIGVVVVALIRLT